MPIAPVQPIRKRPLIPEDSSVPVIGCPMLTRTRMAMPFRGNQQVPLCSVGWALHDEDEVLLCMHTPSRALCWKESPERLNALVDDLRPLIEDELRQQSIVAAADAAPAPDDESIFD